MNLGLDLVEGFVDLPGSVDQAEDVNIFRKRPSSRKNGVGGGGKVSDSVAQRVEDHVDNVELDLAEGIEDSTEDADLGVKEDTEEGSQELGQDDGGEHCDEEGQKLQQPAQIESVNSVGSIGLVSIGGIVSGSGGLSICGVIGRLLIGGGGIGSFGGLIRWLLVSSSGGPIP